MKEITVRILKSEADRQVVIYVNGKPVSDSKTCRFHEMTLSERALLEIVDDLIRQAEGK